jgi:hypothetical protein
MAEKVQSGEVDPIDIALSESYQELQEIIANIEERMALDETLNEILAAKVSRVQEIARILQAPEFYVKKLKKLKTREIAKLISYEKPITVSHIEITSLQRALERMILFKENISKELPEDIPPKISEIPEDYVFESEDSVFLKDLEKFLESIESGKEILIDDLISHKDFEIFLKRFLYVVILISKGDLVFNRTTRMVIKEE